jgi:hypothetical protein
MKLCKGILSRVDAEYGQGLDHVPCTLSLLYAELDLIYNINTAGSRIV